ncbi:GNAT family N-acetyltransferase [Chitinophaga agrisoli]|uniref:GNAT family N-acetyltransferase n=1 Tax=Chitinophaga agrisoli TaxID=2607653 RepID=A0A5B2VWW5_9BACT|nr:GNAT family N-acetyltransferase [Chitinophaga agrisoli]KAA2243274.1 GNAT family N-acetyltransferase [Chitinophaga agrisoli]
MEHQEPVFSHAEPCFPVKDVAETIRYWQEVLGFPNKWTWDDPPTLGAVSWHGAHVQFFQYTGTTPLPKEYSVWIRVRHVDALYALHQQRNANIVSRLEQQPWGMHQYAVRDNNGYYVCFAGPVEDKRATDAVRPPAVKVHMQLPAAEDYIRLSVAVGWSALTHEAARARIAPAVTGVIAADAESGMVIGCVLLMGDDLSYYYVKDVMVHPDWQRKGIGTAMMKALTGWLDTHGADKALVSLITGETLEPFYRQAGFTEAFGMIRYVNKG